MDTMLGMHLKLKKTCWIWDTKVSKWSNCSEFCLSFHFLAALPEWSDPNVWITPSPANLPGFSSPPPFFRSSQTVRCHGGKWAWKWSEEELDSFLCLKIPPWTLLNSRASKARLIQQLQRRWRLRVTSGQRWPLTRSLHEWKQRGMSSNLRPAERGF